MSFLLKSSIYVAIISALVFFAMRVTETASLFGKGDGSPGLFDLLRNVSFCPSFFFFFLLCRVCHTGRNPVAFSSYTIRSDTSR
jgi:hypothetical protein